MAPRKKKKGKANKPTIEIVTKRIVEHGFKTTEGQDRFKSKSVTLYERRDQTPVITLFRAMWRRTPFSTSPFRVFSSIPTMDKIQSKGV